MTDVQRTADRASGAASQARIIDGKAIAARVRAEVAERAGNLATRGVVPGLAVVRVGEDPASAIYVRNKLRACAEAGLRAQPVELPAHTRETEILALIGELNRDAGVHGILVQLPLPGHIDRDRVLDAVASHKDVDGFGPLALGALAAGRPGFVPCTPSGVMRLLQDEGIALAGSEAVIVGRSVIVGRPLALLLVNADATVTVCNSHTRDLAAHTRRADILITAAGCPGLITGDMIKQGAAVIDVGINRLPDGSLSGDVDFASASLRAGCITPVPGGVGPMTVAMLLANTVQAAERAAAA